jgi:hypothetical protein
MENCVQPPPDVSLYSHIHDVGVFVVVSVKLTGRDTTPDVWSAVKLATGEGIAVIYPYCVIVLLPIAFVAVSRISYFPAGNEWTGFLTVENCIQPPPDVSLYSHLHEVGVLVELSANITASGAGPVSGAPEKAATGAKMSTG